MVGRYKQHCRRTFMRSSKNWGLRYSNWRVPGKWAIEIGTRNYKLGLCPIEELQVMKRGSFAWEKIINYCNTQEIFRGGFYEQVEAFLTAVTANLCSIHEHIENFKFYKRIANHDD